MTIGLSYFIKKINKKLNFTEFTIEDAVKDMRKAFVEKKLDPLNNPNYFNIKNAINKTELIMKVRYSYLKQQFSNCPDL